MPRDIPVGNGSILFTFDDKYRIRDIYSPRVGRYNHTDGHVQRFGVWADGQISWIEEDSWERELRYKAGSMTTEVLLVNHELGLELTCNDLVDYHKPVYFKKVMVRDLRGTTRDVRLFFHFDLSINGSPSGTPPTTTPIPTRSSCTRTTRTS